MWMGELLRRRLSAVTHDLPVTGLIGWEAYLESWESLLGTLLPNILADGGLMIVDEE
jgi:hypothetical protein